MCVNALNSWIVVQFMPLGAQGGQKNVQVALELELIGGYEQAFVDCELNPSPCQKEHLLLITELSHQAKHDDSIHEVTVQKKEKKNKY